jgi:mono/diheme cytochrome c family protein
MQLLQSVRSIALALGLVVTLASCQPSQPESEQTAVNHPSRWYSDQQVEQGRLVFRSHCAQCHGENAEGLHEDWKAKLPDGSFPPPPLNGSAHAWHHPLSVLVGVINEGGSALGGNMPGFQTVLTEEEKLAVVAFFQNYWTDEIYANWVKMGGSN